MMPYISHNDSTLHGASVNEYLHYNNQTSPERLLCSATDVLLVRQDISEL